MRPLFEPDRAEPLALFERELPRQDGLRRRELEWTSRGDRVPGLLVLPEGDGPHPLVLLQHGLGGSCRDAELDVRLDWAREGLAVLSVDLPLHGVRRNAKLSERLVDTLAAAAAAGAVAAGGDDTAELLWREFTRQAVLDLRRSLDALGGRDDVDAARIGYAGLGLGSWVGALLCAVDERLRTAALVDCAGFGPADLDPARFVGDIAPRPLLLVHRAGQALAAAAVEALRRAAREPVRLERSETPGGIPPLIGRFLHDALGRPARD